MSTFYCFCSKFHRRSYRNYCSIFKLDKKTRSKYTAKRLFPIFTTENTLRITYTFHMTNELNLYVTYNVIMRNVTKKDAMNGNSFVIVFTYRAL